MEECRIRSKPLPNPLNASTNHYCRVDSGFQLLRSVMEPWVVITVQRGEREGEAEKRSSGGLKEREKKGGDNPKLPKITATKPR